MNLEKLVKCLRKKYEKPLFILFSSDLHGARKIHNSKNVKKGS